MSVQKFGYVYSRFVTRTNLIGIGIWTPLPSDPEESARCEIIHSAGAVQLLNRLLHLWGEYCRHLTLLSALGGSRTLGGSPIAAAPGISTVSDVRNKIRPRFVGPGTRWEDPHWALNHAVQLQITNINQISLGLGAAPAQEVKTIRNFLIHPNEHTNAEYLNLARTLGQPRLRPWILLRNRLPGGGTILESWITDFQNAAYNAAR